MAIKAIVCIGANGVMGKDGKMPWGDTPLDGRHFQNLTKGHTVVMGSKTFRSIGGELPGRLNVIMTRDPLKLATHGFSFSFYAKDISEVFRAMHNGGIEGDIWIIGGASVYEAFLPYIEEFYITTVGQYFAGDVYLPDIFKKYTWKSEYLGMEDIVVSRAPAVSPFDFDPSGRVPEPDELIDVDRYHLTYRKLTKKVPTVTEIFPPMYSEDTPKKEG